MTEKKVLFVSSRESFIVKSIIKKLDEVGIASSFSGMDMKALDGIQDETGLIIYLYIEDNMDLESEEMTYLGKLCTEKDFGLFVIGYEDEIAQLKEGVFQGCITGEFKRPVNAGQLTEEIRQEVDKEAVIEHKKHILVVDDSGIMLSTIKEWLGEKYRVTPVNSALNAISFLTKEKPDLILLDYEMPVCSGPKFLEMIRSDPDSAGIPVIFLTGRDDANSVKEVIALRPEGYLLKSLSKARILGEIDDFFKKRCDGR